MSVTGDARFCALPGAHWLHPQKSSRWPRRWVFFDTEAYRNDKGPVEVQTWRLGVTSTVKWSEHRKTWLPAETVRHETPESLWELVTNYARRSERTVVVAHNIGYDLRISRGLELLPDLGWTLGRPTFNGDHVTLEARKHDLSLVLCDSLTVLPAGIAALGDLMGLPKLPLPDDSADDQTWWARCEQDVEVLTKAYMVVVDWCSKDDLGGWARTGPGIGWHVMLRSHLADNVLVHGRDDVRQAEASAMYAGRAEVWRHGKLTGGSWHEWDYATAYGQVCAQVALPTVLLDEVYRPKLERVANPPADRTYLVEATVAQETPVLPWKDELGIFWPVGSFSGWYWSHEIELAVGLGVTIKPLRAWRYRAAPWLASWGQWCIDRVADNSTAEARIRGLAAKHWQRAVPGRSAMRYRSWEDRGEAWVPGAGYMPLLDADTGARGAALTLGNQRWEAWSMAWWDNALPQLLSSVMAHCRIRLWHAMKAASLSNVAYCDTDSLIVNQAGHERLTEAVADGQLWSLRYKGSHQSLEVTAPQLIEGSTYKRLAGVPKGARRTGPNTYNGVAWEGITTSMAEGHPGEVRIRRATIALTGVDTRRLHLPGGGTAPFEVRTGVRQMPQEQAS